MKSPSTLVIIACLLMSNTSFSQNWLLLGNSGTDTSLNFLGTTDAKGLKFRVNNQQAGFLDYNVATGITNFGYTSLNVNKGIFNTAFGYAALAVNTTGSYNTAMGFNTLHLNRTGSQNTATGYRALFSNNGSGNTAFGSYVLQANTSAAQNSGFGYFVLSSVTTGSQNTGLGSFALKSVKTGSLNTAIGYNALYSDSTGSSNVALGNYALYKNKSGSNAVAIGDSALFNNDNNYHNVAVGSKALYTNTQGYYNVALGYQALYSNTTSDFNTATGYQALFANSYAFNNTANGFQALYANTTGCCNTSTGSASLGENTTGNSNVANGYSALAFNSSGNNNVAVGQFAAMYNTSGNSNVAIGTNALLNNSNGSNIVAIGDSALYNQTYGYFYGNVAIGSKVMYNNTTGFANTATGYQAAMANTTGAYITASGTFALISNTSGWGNTGAGVESLYSNTTGSENTAIGLDALGGNYTGSLNTAIGALAGVYVDGLSNTTAIGYNAFATRSNQVVLGNESITSVNSYGSFVTLSDGRFKKNLQADVPGLAFIKQLRPVTYHYDIRGLNDYFGTRQPQSNASSMMNGNNKAAGSLRLPKDPTEDAAIAAKEKKLYTGFIAQEVEAAAKKLNYDFSGVYAPQNDKDQYGLSYSDFVVPLVKAVQELSGVNDSLKSDNGKLNAKVDGLQSQLNSILQQLSELKTAQAACCFNSSLANSQQPVNGVDAPNLEQNAPNPFNNNTAIRFYIPSSARNAQMMITDVSGQILKTYTLANKGMGQITIAAGELSSGSYFYTLLVDGKKIATKQMVLLQ